MLVPKEMTNLQLLQELEPVAERLLNRHLSMFKEWHPPDFFPSGL
jgi:acyl-[acyl-carrier-protein] desaturase